MNFPPDQLIRLTSTVFEAAGCSTSEAARVGRRLVEANLVGHDSHGVIRIPTYVQWLRDQKTIPNQTIRIITENDAMAVVDGQFGLGQSIGEEAIQLGIDKSRKHGVSIIALRNSGHLGRIGDWAEMAAAAGMISMHFVNTSGAGMLVAPFGGIDRRLSANPFAAGVPTAEGPPIILDMSACTIAEGKIRVALNKGESVPNGCLIDADGNPTNDPAVFYNDPGAILPIAGHKGYGLSLIIEMLAGALTGSSCTNPVNAWRVANGMLSIIIDRNFFGTGEEFFPEVTRFVEFVRSSRRVSAQGEILMPGEIEQRTRTQRMECGVELDGTTWRQIYQTCQLLGVEHSLPAPAAEDLSESQTGGARVNIPGSAANQ